MEINDFEIGWLYILDSGRWLGKKTELKKIAKNMFDKVRIFEGIIRYFTAKEIEDHSASKEKAFFYMKSSKFKEILDLFYKSDMDNIDPEYLENLQFFRAKLTGFELVLPDKRVEPIDVRLLFHSSGIFILEFWLKLKNMALTPEMINELQLLPREEEEITLKLPRKLLKDYSLIKPEIANLLKASSGGEDEPITLNLTFYELVWIYWGIVAYIATNEKAKNSKQLRGLLRYNVFHFYPVLLFHFPDFTSIEDLFNQYKAELYSMSTQEIYSKLEYLRTEFMDEMFDSKNNLADRTDYALYFNIESCLHLYTKNSKSALEYIAKRRSISVENQILLEKLEVVLPLELLQIQRFILMMFDSILSKKSISEMDTDELAQMRGHLSKAIEEFHNIKLMVKTITIARCDKGRESFKLDKALGALEKKLEFVDSAVSSIHNNLMEFLSILIGILVTIGPIIATTIGPSYPIIGSIIIFGFVLGVYFLYKQIYKIWYRKKKI
ncbi:MAG: hypothetical protein ACFFD2_01800 [Promethearchaeota archaeon]